VSITNSVLLQGDCLETLRDIPNDSIDSLITDPPAGISFMGKSWDDDKGGRKQWVAWMTDVMTECLRVLKPGAHGLVWALPRTSHWTATALEDAGFEVRDVVTHLFGSGFPKSLNVSIAIDKAAGALKARGKAFVTAGAGDRSDIQGTSSADAFNQHAGITDAAKVWQGWGTALKPASEHWILVRKPLEHKHTVAANVLKHGTGGINIDASRVGESSAQGRFPANLVLTEGEATEMLDAQASQEVSRFFYCAKISRSERHAGLEKAVDAKRMSDARPNSPDMTGKFPDHDGREKTGNHHPTVKPKKLMSYLIRMITPPGGVVLDPFMGSGSTGLAAKEAGFSFLGVEKEPDYFKIAEQRLA
jgi:DNA modification methylase